MACQPAAPAQEVELKQEDTIHQWPSPPPGFVEIAQSLCGDNPPWVVSGILQNWLRIRAPFKKGGVHHVLHLIVPRCNFQNHVHWYGHTFNELGRSWNCFPSGWWLYPCPPRWSQFGLSTQSPFIHNCLPFIRCQSSFIGCAGLFLFGMFAQMCFICFILFLYYS